MAAGLSATSLLAAAQTVPGAALIPAHWLPDLLQTSERILEVAVSKADDWASPPRIEHLGCTELPGKANFNYASA
jgi:hypothetical protein